MQKLKNSILDKMIHSHLTKAEVDFLLELSHFQDDRGKVYGVYYKNVCEAINISFETFYVTLDSLVKKGFIRKEKAYYGDYDIVINGNDFSYAGALQEGYVSTGHDLFYNSDFKKLKAGEKLLAIQFLKISGAGGRKYSIGILAFYKKYTELMGVAKRTIQSYLARLRRFFNITVKDKLYWIMPLHSCYKYNSPSDLENLSEHLTQVACRRNKATYTTEEYKDTRKLVQQYGKAKSDIAKVFLATIQESIAKSNEFLHNKRKWNRRLNPKFIHKLLENKK